jgi:hypothetical protein
MSDSIVNALQSQGRSSSVLGAIANPVVVNPLAAIGGAVQTARGIADLQTTQFNLQQAQLGPAYQAMRMLMATNPNPTDDDVNAALAQSARIGRNVDGVVNNYTDWRARGGKPADFVRAYALGGMSPESQGVLVGPQRMSQQTAAGTYYGTTPGLWAPGAGTFQPAGFVDKGLSPTEQMSPYTVMGPDRQPITLPAGQVYGGGGGPPTGGGGPGMSASAAVNNFGNIRAPGGGFASYASPQDGVAAMASNLTAYQDQHGINTLNGITARWAPAGDGSNDPAAYAKTLSQLTGIDPNAQLDLHDPATLAKIIPAIAQVEHGRPIAVGGDVLSAGINAGLTGRGSVASGPASGAFIGATSAQPVAGGGAVQPGGGGGGNVQPAGGGGMQYLPASPGGGGGGLRGGYTLPQMGLQPELDAGAKQHAADIGDLATLPQRIQPLMSALNVMKANPDLTTGAGQDQWNTWMGALKGMGLPLPAWAGADKTPAWQELAKYLMQNTRSMPGANQSDMSRLQAEVSSPHIDQQRDAIMELAARQIGLERFRLTGLKYFDSQFSDPIAAASHSGTYRLTTAPLMAKLDPAAFNADLSDPKATQQYYQSLTPQQQARYRESLVVAKQQWGLQLPIAQGGGGGG